MKKLISFILVMVMLMAAFALVSCSDKEKKKDGGVNDISGDAEDNYMVGQYDFEGAVITFPIFGGEGTWYLGVEEKIGETVEDAIYERDKTTEARLNIDIDCVYMPNFEEYKAEIRKVLMAGDGDYDVIMGQQANQIDLCLEGYLLDRKAL